MSAPVPIGATARAQAPVPLSLELELSPSSSASLVVGDRVELVVRLHHAAEERYELTADGYDYSWVVLEQGGAVSVASEAGSTTTYRLALASLEAGEREVPAPTFRDTSGTAVEVLLAASPTLEVGSVLGTGEDAPRPIAGFLEPTAAPSAWPWAWVAVPLVAALALAWWLARRRRARATRPEPRPEPLERLATLESLDLGPAEQPGFAADLHIELTHLVREHFDRRAGTTRVSLTDDEWLIAAGAELSPDQSQALGDLFLESRGIKYGGATPTHWALQESLAAARAVLDGSVSPQEAQA